MNALAKIIFLNFLLVSQYAMAAEAADAKNNSDIPVSLQNNPFGPEGVNPHLRGVRIISVDDKMFFGPDYLKLEQKKFMRCVRFH